MNVEQTIKQMTLEDKVALGSGKDFWHTKEMPQYGIDSIMMSDGQPMSSNCCGGGRICKAFWMRCALGARPIADL